MALESQLIWEYLLHVTFASRKRQEANYAGGRLIILILSLHLSLNVNMPNMALTLILNLSLILTISLGLKSLS